MSPGLIIDLFAGGGGASTGLEAAVGRTVDIAINHDPIALDAHRRNHPHTRHMEADIWEVRPREAVGHRPVWILWASPDCTHFSIAKGGKPRKQGIRSLAWAVVRWARDTQPQIIFLENVAEFRGWGPLDEEGKPIKKRMGESFRRWKRELERLGYVVDFRVLDASHYGAPTKRRRLFLVARRDGQRIQWPQQTHGDGLGLLPARSAAECIDWSIPCPSIFTRKRPLAEKTCRRIAIGIRRFVLENPRPFIVKVNHGGSAHRTESLDAPLTTVTAARRGHALVVPTLVQTGYGERRGQAPRALNLHEPLGTVVAGGSKHALVAAFISKAYGGKLTPGSNLQHPLDTITAQDHNNVVAAALGPPGADRSPQVRAFLTAFYGSGKVGQDLRDPMWTVTTKDRLGLVWVEGTAYQITDIGMRMLKWHEILRAQFGRFAAGYDLSDATTEADRVRLIGNSVCPEVAEAVVAANLHREQIREVA